ncbi:uncharacterized protein F4822DRAFT_149328 [Hypoxylon trugodes]|uniref:uncharacterized protein n=1 Tax=Hypoxylon trugodes TaxID=326681 RepID=UPI0021A1C4B8|nr:uncharacterized protein F4822DRAFT_149328 [Hypoxylon trugodes]KAI1393051.1 hypothetical protein F4822DRAFT_149328 [Hypoxylon trugodes]
MQNNPDDNQSQLTIPLRRDLFQRTNPSDLPHIDKKPFVDRANPTIHPSDPLFKQVESDFITLLRHTTLSIEEILVRIFDPHEITLFQPVTSPPELVQLQRDNIVRYEHLLATRFKDYVPTLEFKLTLLYFGLPVAPMKPGTWQETVPADLEYGDDTTLVHKDPFEFLDNYTERTNGDPSKRVVDPYNPKTPYTGITLNAYGKLRGGAAPDRDEEYGEFPKVGKSIRVFGYQGATLTDSTVELYDSFVEVADYLLKVTWAYDYQIRLEIWTLDNGTEPNEKPVAKATGTVHHGLTSRPHHTDTIYSLLQRFFNSKDFNGDDYCCFVYFDKEEPPSFYKPVVNKDNYVIRIYDNDYKQMVYMRVPPDLKDTYKPNQFRTEYQRAMNILFPSNPHTHLKFDSTTNALTYGLLSPPPNVWGGIITEQAEGNDLPVLSFERSIIPEKHVPIWIPGVHSYNTDFSNFSAIFPADDLALRGNEAIRPGAERLVATVIGANPDITKGNRMIGIDVWLPGQHFLDTNINGRRITLGGGKVGSDTLDSWNEVLHVFQGPRIHAPWQNYSIAARVVYDTYLFYTAAGKSNARFTTDINSTLLTLDEFKKAVRGNLFPDYQEDTQVLHLVQSTWKKNPTDFVINAHTDEADWKWIVRNITEPDIAVSLENWSNKWVVDQDATWGPRYFDSKNLELTSHYASTYKPLPYDPPVEAFFANSDNRPPSFQRHQHLRERYFWDTPSIFVNPAKPAIPGHGPPLETIIHTGPDVPGFTIAMRTPSEVARLEREVHTLRGNLLDRIRECPYVGCDRFFQFQDREGLTTHMNVDHSTLQCFLCDPVKQKLLPFYDQGAIRRHFLDEHYLEFKKMVAATTNDQAGQIPQQEKAKVSKSETEEEEEEEEEKEDVETTFCNRCGRNLLKLNNEIDRVFHEDYCKLGKTDALKYCQYCGEEKSAEAVGSPCSKCGKGKRGSPHLYCESCGMKFDSTMSEAYREHHVLHCKPLGGPANNFCPDCGVSLAGKTVAEKQKHIATCDFAPQDPEDEDEGAHGYYNVTPTPFVDTNTIEIAPLDKYAEMINKLTGSKDKHRKGSKTDESSPKARKTAPKSSQEARSKPTTRRDVRWRPASKSDPAPVRRSRSPNWAGHLEPDHQTYSFQPSPDWRCSRCFRAAGHDLAQIEAHMDAEGSCRIRRGLGTTNYGRMPNRSGWIAPMEEFDFTKTFAEFVRRYPAYRHTMFPVRDSSVRKTWESSYSLNNAIGDIADDPNHPSNIARHMTGDMPWPPYEGTVIPLDDTVPPAPPSVDFKSDTDDGRFTQSDISRSPTESELMRIDDFNNPPIVESSDEEGSVGFPEPPPPKDDKKGKKNKNDKDDSSEKRKRKRDPKDDDFVQHSPADDVEEEYSEVGADPDTPKNLTGWKPPTPKKRKDTEEKDPKKPSEFINDSSSSSSSSGKSPKPPGPDTNVPKFPSKRPSIKRPPPLNPQSISGPLPPPSGGPSSFTPGGRPHISLPPDVEALQNIVKESGRGSKPAGSTPPPPTPPGFGKPNTPKK